MTEETTTVGLTYLGHDENNIIVEDFEDQEVLLPRSMVKLPRKAKVGKNIDFEIPISLAEELSLP